MLSGCGGVSAQKPYPDSGTKFDASERRDGEETKDGNDDRGASDAVSKRDAKVQDEASDASGGCNAGEPGVQCVGSVAALGPTYGVAGRGIAVDSQNVYWVAGGQEADEALVVRTPRSGGATATLALGSPISLVSDGTNLYWADSQEGAGRVVSVPVGGGVVTTLASAGEPACITADETNVYWTDSGFIGRVGKVGGTATTIVMSGAGAIAVDATNLYWTSGGAYSMNKSGGNIVTLLSESTQIQPGCESVALAGNRLFVLTSFSAQGNVNDIDSVAIDTPGVPTIVVSSGNPSELVAGSAGLFWLGFGSALEIEATSLDAGSTTTLATPPSAYVGNLALASDGTLYWTTATQVQAVKP
jgi:hypothetical protein